MMNKQFNQISKDEIVNICGEYPDGVEAADILSDPDFVFTNDVNYSTVKLFDIDGNSVFVNSFTEICITVGNVSFDDCDKLT